MARETAECTCFGQWAGGGLVQDTLSDKYKHKRQIVTGWTQIGTNRWNKEMTGRKQNSWRQEIERHIEKQRGTVRIEKRKDTDGGRQRR